MGSCGYRQGLLGWGAVSRRSEILSATAGTSGSPKSRAASAEASRTLAAIAVGAQERGGLGRRDQGQASDLGQHVLRRQGSVGARGGLDDREQLTLKRAVVACCSLAQVADDLLGRVLDRERGMRFRFGAIMGPDLS